MLLGRWTRTSDQREVGDAEEDADDNLRGTARLYETQAAAKQKLANQLSAFEEVVPLVVVTIEEAELKGRAGRR